MIRKILLILGRAAYRLLLRLDLTIQSIRARLLAKMAPPPVEPPPPPPQPFLDLQNGRFPLCSHWWRFSRSDDVLVDRMKFLPDGRILDAPHFNERTWRIKTGEALHILSIAGEVTSIFDEIIWTGSVPVLKGRYLLKGDVTHILTPNLEDMHVEIFQTKFRGGMLIVPNSRGRNFDGMMTRWELWHLPREAGIDHMRLSEHFDSKCWYTNKVIRIMQQLRVFVAQGYDSFCFFGLSSGGYAALLLAEHLATEFPGVKIRSIAINPQTQLGEEVAYHFASTNISPFLWPDLITEEDLAQRDIALFNLQDVIASPSENANVEHHVFYDAGNACEAYFIDSIKTKSSITLHPFSYALPHSMGIAKIFEDNKPEIEGLILSAVCRGARRNYAAKTQLIPEIALPSEP